jgi:hypothetical protein
MAFAGAPINPDLLAKAVHWAGLWDHSSKSMLKYQFGLDDNAATGLFDALVKKQVITNPDARGMSKVMISTYKNPFHAAQVERLLSHNKTVSAPKITMQPVTNTTIDQIDQSSDTNANDTDQNDAHSKY